MQKKDSPTGTRNYLKRMYTDSHNIQLKYTFSNNICQFSKREEKRRVYMKKETKLEERAKIKFANSVETAENSILIGDLAKLIKQNGYEIGQNRLFHWLRENGYLIKVGERRNLPTQSAMNLGLFEIKERTVKHSNGTIRIIKTTRVTGKGQIYFMDKFIH